MGRTAAQTARERAVMPAAHDDQGRAILAHDLVQHHAGPPWPSDQPLTNRFGDLGADLVGELPLQVGDQSVEDVR